MGDLNVSGDGASCEPAPLGRGLMPREHVLGLIERHVPKDTPIVLCSAAIDQQLAWPTYRRIGMTNAAYKILAGEDGTLW